MPHLTPASIVTVNGHDRTIRVNGHVWTGELPAGLARKYDGAEFPYEAVPDDLRHYLPF